ncbi:apses transcription factor StuA [Aspergillus steynii IBT 23096]|uniref:Cell pattern formation-associated protein stuA n=1 Tax=Aspergillus steynii IBT 23096 TaxID=1392250 RepID=A0A2I2G2H9_9EURO|nr:apses transcription factor StuA [Aspergillus steynii IBT 23096]PLB47057.1 apses transcription factor StuA [Aspergillus steynii IBT 23096]
MNQTQPYMDVHSSHLSSAQPYASHAATAGGIPHYQYHQQPPVLQPASTSYGPASSYSQYAYPGGVTSSQGGHQPPTSMGAQVPAQLLPLPVTNHPVATQGYANTTGAPLQGYIYDATGQVAPPGAKPRVTATLWEDEGSLCYQVESKGVCVARREDNHMINGTKLLNVAGMTRGRRDGILKSEKIRHVVKIGPMHLKGVIPFERALEFANKEKITDLLYPLFVHNIGGLLYHPTNQTRTNMVVQESQQRRLEGPQAARASQGPQPPPLHHHHSLQTPVPSHMPQPSTIGSQGRPGLERAPAFPTPPASASSLMGLTSQGHGYEWGNQGMNSGVPHSQPLSIDTTLSNARSMPTTPATTPPGSGLQGMQSYQPQSGYDSSKPYYSTAPASHAHYAPQQPLSQPTMASYGQSMQPNSYIKNEMGPPSGRTPGGPQEAETGDVKSERYSQSNGHVGNGVPEHVPEHESAYVQHDNGGYNTSRGSYTYTTNPSVGSLTGDHSQLTPDVTGSPSQQNGSGRMTPRTSGGPPPQWASGYNTPPRPAAAGSLYNIVSDTRGTPANGTTSDNYSVASNSASGYSTGMNGSLGSGKRLREDDDVDRIVRPDSRDADYGSKRRKTLTDVGGPVGVHLPLQPMKAGGVMSRRQ